MLTIRFRLEFRFVSLIYYDFTIFYWQGLNRVQAQSFTFLSIPEFYMAMRIKSFIVICCQLFWIQHVALYLGSLYPEFATSLREIGFIRTLLCSVSVSVVIVRTAILNLLFHFLLLSPGHQVAGRVLGAVLLHQPQPGQGLLLRPRAWHHQVVQQWGAEPGLQPAKSLSNSSLLHTYHPPTHSHYS